MLGLPVLSQQKLQEARERVNRFGICRRLKFALVCS